MVSTINTTNQKISENGTSHTYVTKEKNWSYMILYSKFLEANNLSCPLIIKLGPCNLTTYKSGINTYDRNSGAAIMNKDLNSTHIYYFYQVNSLKGVDKKTVRREEKSFYLCSLFSNTLFIRKQNCIFHYRIFSYSFLP